MQEIERGVHTRTSAPVDEVDEEGMEEDMAKEIEGYGTESDLEKSSQQTPLATRSSNSSQSREHSVHSAEAQELGGDGWGIDALPIDSPVVGGEDVGVCVDEGAPTVADVTVSPTVDRMAEVKAVENHLVGEYRRDSFACLNLMRRQPIEKFAKLRIPLCRMQCLPEVRHTLRSDVLKLMREFRFGYRAGQACFYVALTNKEGDGLDVTEAIERTWNEHWVEENSKFEAGLVADSDLRLLSGKMFYVWDGNHRLAAWKEFIEGEHKDDAAWYELHGNPYSMILDIPRGGARQVVNAMHDINL